MSWKVVTSWGSGGFNRTACNSHNSDRKSGEAGTGDREGASEDDGLLAYVSWECFILDLG